MVLAAELDKRPGGSIEQYVRAAFCGSGGFETISPGSHAETRVTMRFPIRGARPLPHQGESPLFLCVWGGYMSWLYLILAGLFEIGWPVGLKMAQVPDSRWCGIGVALLFMGLSGVLLWLAQRHIPIGTAYAVWTGIGAAGTFLVGVLYYGDPMSIGRVAGVILIVGGVVTLKLAQ